jgi:hypothetical protein
MPVDAAVGAQAGDGVVEQGVGEPGDQLMPSSSVDSTRSARVKGRKRRGEAVSQAVAVFRVGDDELFCTRLDAHTNTAEVLYGTIKVVNLEVERMINITVARLVALRGPV